MMRTALVGIALLLGGCFQIDMTSGKFRCDSIDDPCPSGQACLGGLCQSRGDESQFQPDLATPVIDAGAPAAGCTGPGQPMVRSGNVEIYGCRGRFAAGQFANLCRSGYHVCGVADEAALATLDLDGRCGGVSGFYAAQIEATLNAENALECRTAAPSSGDRALLLGCGIERAGMDSAATQEVGVGCRKLRLALACGSGAAGWTCTSRLQDAAHTEDSGGVLCCK